MSKIKYIKEDVRKPEGEGKKFIVHCCNNLGVMGSGVALALAEQWPKVRSEYVKWNQTQGGLKLGTIQAVIVEDDIAVINMIGQVDIKPIGGKPPVRYEAVDTAIKKVADLAKKYNASVHVPYLMCCDRAGGEWNKIEEILEYNLCDNDIGVTVYDKFGQRQEA